MNPRSYKPPISPEFSNGLLVQHYIFFVVLKCSNLQNNIQFDHIYNIYYIVKKKREQSFEVMLDYTITTLELECLFITAGYLGNF